MAFITVLARRKTVSTFQLRAPTTVGRSMDCDIYIPDVFVSRQHCRFAQRDGHWHIVDTQSRNGIWHEGKRVGSHLLKPGDLIEIGTIAIRFNSGDSDQPSHPAPLGMGPGVTELMDTVYAHGMRPSRYAKKQKSRAAEWRERVKSRLAERPEEHDFEPVPVMDTEPWKREEWAELDMEQQIAAGQDHMTDWEPPIFNPKRKPDGAIGAGGTVAVQELDSIDEEVERLGSARGGESRPAEQTNGDYAGIEFVPYTWRDRLVDSAKERLQSMRAFTKLNPQLAAGIVIGLAALIYAVVKYAPIKSGAPHFYVPPPQEVAQTQSN